MEKLIPMLSLFVFFGCKDTKQEKIPVKNSEIKRTEKTVSPKNNADNFDENVEVSKILIAFKNKDEKTLNSHINPEIGFYIIPGPGLLKYFEPAKEISWKNDLVNYNQFAQNVDLNFKIITPENRPSFDCEKWVWDKVGLYKIKGNAKVLENIWLSQILGGVEVDSDLRKDAKKIDTVTTVIYLTEKEGNTIFGYTVKDGKIWITFLDLSQMYCDV